MLYHIYDFFKVFSLRVLLLYYQVKNSIAFFFKYYYCYYYLLNDYESSCCWDDIIYTLKPYTGDEDKIDIKDLMAHKYCHDGNCNVFKIYSNSNDSDSESDDEQQEIVLNVAVFINSIKLLKDFTTPKTFTIESNDNGNIETIDCAFYKKNNRLYCENDKVMIIGSYMILVVS